MKASLFLAASSLLANAENVEDAIKKKSYMAMNPEHVAILLRDTQQEWVDFALHEKSGEAEKNMVDNCAIVAQGMVDGSDGDKERVDEYFREVCSVGKQGVSGGAQREGCQNFAQGLLGFMTNDPEANRNSLDARGFCTKFWQDHMTTYVQAAEARRAAEAEAKRREREEMAAQKRRSVQLAKERAEQETKRQDEIRLANAQRAAEERLQKNNIEAQVKATEKKAADLHKKMDETKEKMKSVSSKSNTVVEDKKSDKKVTEVKSDKKEKKEKTDKKNVIVEAVENRAKSLKEMASDKFNNFVSYFSQSAAAKKNRMKTMADVFRKESTYMMHLSREGAAIKAVKRSSSKKHAASKMKISTDNKKKSATDVKTEAKAIVAEKVKAIKQRIAMKFKTAENAKKRSPELQAKEGLLRKIEKNTEGLGDLSLR